jgi:DNA-binding PucR family transcriptional regulator
MATRVGAPGSPVAQRCRQPDPRRCRGSALADCGRVERERLIEAVRAYLASGSIGASAAELFCHRNTVANRLRRFSELTGVDPMIPAEAARLVVGWS